jgi:cyanophycinase-like exopeptidase
MTLTSIMHQATRAGSAVGGAAAGAPWWVMVGVFVLSLATEGAWRVYTNPALMREWLELRDERRHR